LISRRGRRGATGKGEAGKSQQDSHDASMKRDERSGVNCSGSFASDRPDG
jgi:hypothetical protein